MFDGILLSQNWFREWASYQIRKIAGCACGGNVGNAFPPPRVSDPDMHQGTCVTHVPWCMPGSLTNGFLWGQWRGNRSRHSRRMRNPQFYVSGTRHMAWHRTGITIAIMTRFYTATPSNRARIRTGPMFGAAINSEKLGNIFLNGKLWTVNIF